MSRLPASTAVRIDRLNPRLANSWGGPMNGQHARREIAREIASVFDFDCVIETGTFRGVTTEFLRSALDAPVITVEAVERYFLYSKMRFANIDTVEVAWGDSRKFLRDLAVTHSEETVFFYLAAHWEKDLPLREELIIICSAFERAIVMIDDFKVPDDAGYRYDDYGPGAALTADYLPGEELRGWCLMYPSTPSNAESGARRGCAVLIAPALSGEVGSLRTLRRDEAWNR